MALVVQKYGGTSVANAEKIRNVARRIVDSYNAGNGVVAVVSAMGKRTDELLSLAAEVSDGSHPRELDMLLTAGERVTMALVAMAIQDLGVDATSFTGSQAGILTTGQLRFLRSRQIEFARASRMERSSSLLASRVLIPIQGM
jgi:aspartate kinase